MPPRSLPERTVDAWVSAVVCGYFPNALIWAPTQVLEDTNWDYGVSLGDGKVFIFEDKATVPVERKKKFPLQTHRIKIDRDQLDWYCDTVEPALDVPVFYVLPAPPWVGLPTGSVVVPDQAVCRVQSPSGPFEEWAFVVRCYDLRNYLGPRVSVDTSDLPLPMSTTLAGFLAQVGGCVLGRRVEGRGDGGQGAAKGIGQDTADGANVATNLARDSDRPVQRTGSALGVFIPTADLSGGGPGPN